MRTITIYDYNNRAVLVEVPDKKIVAICVTVLSGDETGTIHFADGDRIQFDASDTRVLSFYDGYYEVIGDNIEKWLNYEPSGYTFSYDRKFESTYKEE